MKCKVCKQMYLKDVKKLSKTKKNILPKTCPGCRILAPRASKKGFREKRK